MCEFTVKIEGNHPNIQRIKTGYYSLDHAFINHKGDLGMPIGVGYEIFGATGIGKSTLAYSLAGMLADDIVLCDFEGFDVDFLERVMLSVGYDGNIHVLSDIEDEKQLMNTLDLLADAKQKYNVAILDSISAISPISEMDGDIGEANMGKRAFTMAQFSRKALHIFRFAKEPKTIIAINHWRPTMSGRGWESPGGIVKNYLLTVRILLKRVEEFPDGSYILQGKAEKNRWGYSDRLFFVFMLAGYGLHAGLSAVWDCVILKVAKYENGTIKIGTQSYGRLSTLVKSAKAGEDIFKPFKDELEKLDGTQDTGTENEGNELSEVDEVQN